VTEIWGTAVNNEMPDIRRQALEMEAAGYDGCYMSDSQNIRMECWVALTVAALATERIKVGPFVTNSLTRHPSVTAGAAATLQEVTGGRVVLAVGRGDSALANLGRGPAPVRQFEAFLLRLQAYLAGAAAEFDPAEMPGVPLSHDLGYRTVPQHSRIRWLPSARPKVPVNVVASGRRVLTLGARLADEVTMVVGGDPQTLKACMAHLRGVRADAGLDPDTLALSAMVPVAVADGVDDPTEQVARLVGELGRWMTTQGGSSSLLDEQSASAFADTVAGYDMTKHGPDDAPATPAVTNTLPAAVARRHGVAGAPEEVADRLRAIMNLGLTRLVIGHTPAVAQSVLPLLRA
jgi:5,10-methylenetetrahydromethanopterin reductase